MATPKPTQQYSAPIGPEKPAKPTQQYSAPIGPSKNPTTGYQLPSNFVSGGGGSSGGNNPAPLPPPSISVGAQAALDAQAAGKTLTDSQKVALNAYKIRNYAAQQGVSIASLSPLQEQNLIRNYNQSQQQQSQNFRSPESLNGSGGVVTASKPFTQQEIKSIRQLENKYSETKFGKYTKQVVSDLSEGVDNVISLGGRLNRKPLPKEVYPVAEASPGTGGRGTSTYRNPTIAEMNPEQRLQTRLNQLAVDVTFNNLPEKDYTSQLSKINTEYQKDVLLSDIPLSFARGAVFGGVTALAPPIGLTFGSISLGKTAIDFPEVAATAKANPFAFSANVGAGLAGGIVGGAVTYKTASKVQGYVRTLGKEFIDPETGLILPEVLSGKKTFPETSTYDPLKRVEIFLKQTYKIPGEKPGDLGIYHASPGSFGKNIVAQAGSSEFKGLYGAPSLSAYFLKIQSLLDKYSIGFDMQSALEQNPTALKVYVKGFKATSQQRGVLDIPEGYAGVPAIKPEIEAIIPESTKMIRIGNRFYSKYKGTRFPLQQYKTLTSEEAALLKDVETLGDVLSKSAYRESSPIKLQSIVKGYDLNAKPSYSGKSKSSSSKGGISARSYIYSPGSSFSNVDYSLNSYNSKIDNQVYNLSYKGSSPSYKPLYPRSNPPYSPPPTPPYPQSNIEYPSFRKGERKRRTSRRSDLYSAFVKRRGKMIPIITNVSEAKAFQVAQDKTLKSLARTLYVKKTGSTFSDVPQEYFRPDPNLFRGYKIRNRKKQPLPFGTFIQRRGINTKSEVSELNLNKIIKQQNNYFKSKRKRRK